MSVKRTLFAADKTGFHLLHTLFQTSMRYEKISRHDEWFVTSILVDDGQVYGLTALNIRTGELNVIRAKAVILATGGAGKIYEFTTNGNIKTADGMAMAFRAGVPLKDMEFVQFHPTALPGTGILITEAARGEGGYLVNKDGERFLKRYVPNKMELGPRDILSRAIMNEIKENRALEGPYGSYVLLDLRHLGEEVIDNKLPFIRELARNYIGLDPVHEAIPVRPAQHYIMGGVHTDMAGFTGLPGLYAAGEVACVTINGANRLGSNSLAECLVFGAEAGKAAAIYAAGHVHKSSQNPVSETVKLEEKRIFDGILKKEQGSERVADIRNQMQHVTDTYVGIHREQAGLEEAARTLKQLRTRFAQVSISDKDTVFNTDLIAALELDFMLDTAYAVTVSALNRHESRGAHSRIDYPKRDDERFLRHLLAYRSEDGVRIDTMPVTITNWKPAERKY
jgi:succinate dehydrogenase/fumarate reductase flavoprotein subunit